MDDVQFRQLLDHLGYCWRGYRKIRKGVKKRVAKHMQQIGCRSIGEYLHALQSDEDLRENCERIMTVSVSRFFRDRALWRIMGDDIVPYFLREKDEKVRFWSAGCACGEEVYSLMILWESLKGRFGFMPTLEVWATDLNPDYLRRAEDGIYPLSSLKEIPPEQRKRYFTSYGEGSFYRIVPSLKRGITWMAHNLLLQFDESGFQIIFLRNSILTYYRDEIKRPAFEKVVSRLAEGGFLIIGSHEKLPAKYKHLLAFGSTTYIFKKRGQ